MISNHIKGINHFGIQTVDIGSTAGFLIAELGFDTDSEYVYERAGGVVDPLPEDAPFFVRDYHDYYKTPRGYHSRSLNSNEGWSIIGTQSFLNQPILAYAHEIESAVMVLHGDAAHSCYMGKDAFSLLEGDNKELVLVPGAVHTDLYDGGGKNAIPWDRIQGFFERYLQ